MSKIIENTALSRDFYLMKAEHANSVRMGQFYMLRSWKSYPVLSRPFSVYDTDGETITFLYKVMGQGTEIFSKLKAGDDVTLDGPHGNGFPEAKGKIALVGGGVGIAPFYLTAKELKKANPDCTVDIYLGFSDVPVLVKEFESVSDSVKVNVGGFITDDIDPTRYDTIMTCGPEIMMKVLYEKCVRTGAKAPLYVSMENRMACGIGACFACTCKTTAGNKRVCKEGPVLLGSEVFGK